MLVMRDIRKVYRTDLIETHALSDFSLHVRTGEFVAVMGPSGSGKTTFLNVAGLLDTFDAGTYELDGKDVSRLSDDEMSRFRNRKIGFVFQSFNLIAQLSLLENLEVPLFYQGVPPKERRQRAERLANTVGLGDATGLYHGTQPLNQGQMDRWNIVVTLNYLAHDREVDVVLARCPEYRTPAGRAQVSAMVALAGLTRRGFSDGDLSTVMSPRTVVTWAENATLFHDLALAFKLTFLNRCDEDERAIVAEYYQRCIGADLD